MTTNNNPGAQGERQERATPPARLAAAAVTIFEVAVSIARALREFRRQPLVSGEAPHSATSSRDSTAQGVSAFQPATGAPETGADSLSPRTLDRNLDAEPGANPKRRESLGTVLAAFTFLAAITGGFGFLVAYWADASNLFLGGSLALALGGFGATLVIWGRMLTVQREAIALREPLRPSVAERQAADEAFTFGAQDIRRRCMLRWIGFTGAAMFTTMAASLLRSLGLPSYAALNSPIWRRGQRLMTADGKSVSINSIQPGNTLTVFPEDSIGDERSQTVLVRVDQTLLELPQDRKTWAPNGILAYSRVCTHAGCTVGLYEKTSYLLMCPCHQSTFDVLRAARPNGGPAARPLPQLPIYADSDGILRAGGGFSQPPGPGFWGMA